MRELKDITFNELSALANLATAGYLNSKFSRNLEEQEVGGYGKRKRITWIMNVEGYDEYHYFEISSESKNCWTFHCKVGTNLDSVTKKPKYEHMIIIQNVSKIIDYCRNNNMGIDN